MRALEKFKLKNHKVYLQRSFLSVEQMNHLAVALGIYPHGITKSSKVYELKQTKSHEVASAQGSRHHCCFFC
jgi:hypothetical protein